VVRGGRREVGGGQRVARISGALDVQLDALEARAGIVGRVAEVGASVSTLAAGEVLTASALPAASTEKYRTRSPSASVGFAAESYAADAVVGSGGSAPIV
jgi:hypothetical protein